MKKVTCLAAVLVMAATCLSVQPAQAAEHAGALKAYKAVLQNEVAFYNINDEKNNTLNELRDKNDEPLEAESFAVVDMDSDGTPEVVLDFGGPYNDVVVLHYEGGKVYGFSIPYTYSLTNDGIYNGSLQAWFFTYCKVKSIAKDSYRVDTLARVEADLLEEDKEPFYYIGEAKVTKDEYDNFVQSLLESRQENEAVWHDFTAENIASVCK